jgi:hypothetical protein
MEWWLRHSIAHQVAHIMVARHTVDRQFQWSHEFAKTVVGLATVILDQVAGHCYQVSLPVIGLNSG